MVSILSKTSILQLFLINQFFKKYFFILAFTIFVLLSIYFSDSLGLGVGESFIFFKIFGIKRFSFFMYSIYFLFLCLTLRAIPFFNRGSFSTVFVQNIFLKIGTIIIFFVSCFKFLKTGYLSGYSAYELETISNFSMVVKELHNGILENDFYTKAISSSPRLIISKLLLLPSKLGIDWYSGVYLYKVIFRIIYMPLLFLCMHKIITQNPIKRSIKTIDMILISTIIFSIISTETIINMQRSWDIAGFPTIFKDISIATKHYALIVGLIYLFTIFSQDFRYKIFISSALLAFSSLVHVLIGLAIFCVMVIYKGSNNKYILDKKILINFFFGIILPIIFLLSISQNPNPISNIDFIQIYVFETHPYHYLMSEILGWSFIKWSFIYFIYFFISMLMKNRVIIKINFLSLVFFVLPPLMQYIGTEIYQFKFIAILGINRLSSFHSFMICTNSLIIMRHSNIFKIFGEKLLGFIRIVKKKNDVNYNFAEIYFYKSLVNACSIKNRTYCLIMFLTLIIIWNKTDHSALNTNYMNDNYKSLPSFCSFLKKNTKNDAVIFSKVSGNNSDVYLNTAIRTYAHRAIFTDWAFPFNESFLKEYMIRSKFYNRFPDLTFEEFYDLKKKYKVTHILMKNYTPNKFEKIDALWKDEKFILFDLDKIIKSEIFSKYP